MAEYLSAFNEMLKRVAKEVIAQNKAIVIAACDPINDRLSNIETRMIDLEDKIDTILSSTNNGRSRPSNGHA